MNSQTIIINIFAMIKHQTYFGSPESKGKIENQGAVLSGKYEPSNSFMSSFGNLHNRY